MLLYNKVQPNLAQVQLCRKRYFIINSSHANNMKWKWSTYTKVDLAAPILLPETENNGRPKGFQFN